MRRRSVLVTTASFLLSLLAPAGRAAAGGGFDAWFTGDTMRVDLYRTVGNGVDVVAFDAIVDDGPWPGSRTHLVDGLGLGELRYEVRDAAGGELLFSRGYASLLTEWLTTPESRTSSRTFAESLRFPWPKAPVVVSLHAREKGTAFRKLWEKEIEPENPEWNRERRRPLGRVVPLEIHGPVATKVDLLMISEGYTATRMPKFRADAKRLLAALFAEEPFKSRRRDFNVRLLEIPASRSGAFRPASKRWRRTPLSVRFGVFGSERYLLTFDDRTLRDAAASAPCDVLEILVDDPAYGGGGIYNFQSTVSAGSVHAPYVFVHEFGHHFAALADEYYTSDVAYEKQGPGTRPEPWEPNVTALNDPASLKWRDLVEAGTPLPTPWEKETFDRHGEEIRAERRRLVAENAPPAALDALFSRQKAWESALLRKMPWFGKVGAFEGGLYEAQGLYRPEADCIMFSRNDPGFCRVCRRTLERVIDSYQ